jgi:hypothetical protein
VDDSNREALARAGEERRRRQIEIRMNCDHLATEGRK